MMSRPHFSRGRKLWLRLPFVAFLAVALALLVSLVYELFSTPH
jgi:hypothetical protein